MGRETGPPGAPTAIAQMESDPGDDQQLILGDLINRVLDKGVVISGQVTISVADIDLIALDLRLLISSIQTAVARGSGVDTRRAAP